MKKTFQAVDLGQAQNEAVLAAIAFRSSQTAFAKAEEALAKAEARHQVAQKALSAAAESVRQATKVL